MKRILSFALTIVVLLSMLPMRLVHAEGQTLIEDQSFTTPSGINVSFAAPPLVYVAQTFTPAQSGILRAVSIDIDPGWGGDIWVEIRKASDGIPTDTVLAKRLLSLDELQVLAADPLSYQITVPDVYVTAGKKYAIVLSYNSYTNDVIPQGKWFGAQGDKYTRGAAFTAVDAPSLTWIREAKGRDLHFRTFVITGVPVSNLKIERVYGTNTAHACEVFKESYRITNLGPDPATDVMVTLGGTDHFNFVSVDDVNGSITEPFDMAVGESRKVFAYFEVVAYVPGEMETGGISATISSDPYPDIAYDPKMANNEVSTEIHMLGEPVMTCPE